MKNCSGGNALREQLGVRMGWRVGPAHLVGALFAAVSGSLASANIPGHGHGFGAVDFILFAAYVPISGVACALRSTKSYKRATVWLGEERPPTREEQRHTLRLPFTEAVEGMGPWLLAAVIWVALNIAYYGNSVTFATRVGLSILLGGLATSALVYLLVERTFRPLFALALAGDVPERSGAMSVRSRLMLAWALGADLFLVMIGLTYLGRPAGHPPSAAAIWFLVDSGLIAGAVVLYVAARSVADPLRDLRQAVRRVQAGDLDFHVAVDDGAEVGLLQAGFNKMVVGLRERRQLQDLFGRYVGEDVARDALERGVQLGGERREVSALFVDLIGSTTLAQTRSPDDVVELLNRFFDIVVRTVAAEGGWVNKFEGDGALCVFGAPMAQDDHATRALRAARTIRREILALSARQAGVDAAIGVSSGSVVAGNVGAEQRYEYTVIGDPVNQAARLTDEAKHRLGRVLASEEAIARADGEGRSWVVADELQLRGRTEATLVYEPVPAGGVRELV
jgi:adenylate cyclase